MNSRFVARLLVSVLLVTALAWTVAGMSGCQGSKGNDPWGGTTKPRVLTTIVPLHCAAASIAEPDAEVLCLLTTTGPHEFEFSPYDVKLVSTARLFVVNGLQLESGLEPMIHSSGNRTVEILRTGEEIPAKQIIEVGEQRHGDHVHPAGSDPHVWLGIDEMKVQVEAIRDRLIKIDPAHAQGYSERTAAYLAKLDKLKEHGKELPGLRLVSFHDSFRYFGRTFGIEIVGTIRGVKGGEMTQQANQLRGKVDIIGTEPQYDPEPARALAKQLSLDKVRLTSLDPIETADGKAVLRDYYVDKDYYLNKMRENIDHLLQEKRSLSRGTSDK